MPTSSFRRRTGKRRSGGSPSTSPSQTARRPSNIAFIPSEDEMLDKYTVYDEQKGMVSEDDADEQSQCVETVTPTSNMGTDPSSAGETASAVEVEVGEDRPQVKLDKGKDWARDSSPPRTLAGSHRAASSTHDSHCPFTKAGAATMASLTQVPEQRVVTEPSFPGRSIGWT